MVDKDCGFDLLTFSVGRERVSSEQPEKKKELISEGSDEENQKSVSEGSEVEKTDSSVSGVPSTHYGMTLEQYEDSINDLFDNEGVDPAEDDSDDDINVFSVFLRGKFDLEGPRAKDWRESADFSNLALEKYNKENGTNYELVEVVKVNTEVVGGFAYFITFTAKDATAVDGVPKIFQTIVYDLISTGVEVSFCRLKPTKYLIGG